MESDNPRVMEAVAHVRDTCKRYGVAPGIHTSGPAAANRRIGEGFQFIAVASELRFMLAGAREVISGVTLPDGRRLGQQTAESVRY